MAAAVFALCAAGLPVGSPAAAAAVSAAAVDPQDRGSVASLYRDVIAPALAVKGDWSGSVEGCQAGSLPQEARDAQVATLNAVRALVGVPAVTENASMSALAQEAALIMDANRALSHYPPSDWACWSPSGAEGAKTSNIALGWSGARAVVAYMTDSGESNTAVGHRRWLLYPKLVEVGIGDSGKANAIAVIGGPRAALSGGWAAWPSQGFFPAPLWPQDAWDESSRWSVSYPGADFSSASVSVLRDGSPVSVAAHEVVVGYGDNTLVWQVDTPAVEGGPDVRFDVTVVNVVLPGGQAVDYRYSTTVIDPFGPPPAAPGNVVAAVQKDLSVRVEWSAPSFTGGSAIESYQVYAQDGARVCVTSGALSCVASGVRAGSRVTFVVTAANRAGESAWSVPSAEALVARSPGKVRALKVACRASACVVSWRPGQDGGSRITGYQVAWRSADAWRSVSGSSVVLPKDASRPGLLRVRAVNGVGPGRVAQLRVRFR